MAADPERRPDPNDCTAALTCPVDPRTTGWTNHGGIVDEVLYTSRSGATMSGHVWATKSGPAKRPGIVLVNGSIVGSEQVYWYLAQTLARAGFVVMTFDPQGEGSSDQFGEAPDEREDAFAGTPGTGPFGPPGSTGDATGGNGLAFYDGGQDALDFFVSAPTKPYSPRPSRTTHTSHDAKQQRRAQSGLNAGWNPLSHMIDPTRLGMAGHSYGAVAASWLTQHDRRLSGAVALDSLCVPVSPSPPESAVSQPNPDFGGMPSTSYGLPRDCFAAPAGPAPRITKPILGIASDYFMTEQPYLRPPNPLAKARASLAYSDAGVDTGQIVIRGGTHYEFNDAPEAAPASLRGIDLAAWYTAAWLRKYVAREPGADDMLLSRRWLADDGVAEADPAGDGNAYSWHLRSRLDIHREDGTRFRCENLRTSCPGMVPADRDGWPSGYSWADAVR